MLNLIRDRPIADDPLALEQLDIPHIYSDLYRPTNHRTESEWLRQGFRVRGDAAAKLLLLRDSPRGHHRLPSDPIDAEFVQALHDRLDFEGVPSDPDRRLINRLDLSNQAIWMNLYSPDSVVPITRLTQSEAWSLLVGLWRAGSDDRHIHGRVEDGQKLHWTDEDGWEYRQHRQGLQYIGPRAGKSTRMLVIDLDRHDLSIPAGGQIERVLEVLRFLQEHHAEYAPHIGALNPNNGSCHIVLYFPRSVPIHEVHKLSADLRRQCPAIGGSEIYPDNLRQVICPLRLDKQVVIDRVLAPSVKAHRWARRPARRGRKGTKVRIDYRAHDAVAYWEWINDPDRRPCDLLAVEQLLREACRQKATTAITKPVAIARCHKPMSSVISFKGQTAKLLTGVFSGTLRPDDDTITRYTTVALRVLCRIERMDRDEAVEWIMERLDGLEDQSFSDRLVENRDELVRNLAATAKKIWAENGYQQDAFRSNATWERVRTAWSRRGFRLSDPSTWERASAPLVADPRELDWTGDLYGVLGGLIDVANCTLDEAKHLLSLVCSHVAAKNELSLSFLGVLIRECGLKTCQDKNVAVRRYLVESGVLKLVRRGFRAIGDEGSGVGNHYVLGLVVQFATSRCPFRLFAEPAEKPNPPVSTYVSLDPARMGIEVMRQRVQACLDHWYDRLRAADWWPQAA